LITWFQLVTSRVLKLEKTDLESRAPVRKAVFRLVVFLAWNETDVKTRSYKRFVLVQPTPVSPVNAEICKLA
jgi:hypothetical protein